MSDEQDQRPAWSREPFQPGNVVSLRSGARSPRTVAARATQIEEDSRSSTWWPDYLRDESFAPEVTAWAVAEAVVSLLRDYLGTMPLVDALAEVTTEQGEETTAGGRTERISTARRTEAALKALHTAENRAARLRSRLGLEPTARARLQRDLSASRYMAGLGPGSALIEALDAKAAARAALEQAEHDGNGPE